MLPKDLLQALKAKIEVDNQFRESPVICELHTDNKIERAIVSVEIEGKIRVVEILAKEIGTYKGIGVRGLD